MIKGVRLSGDDRGRLRGVEGIGLDRPDRLGMGAEGNRYRNGQRIEVRRGIALTRWQRIGAIVTATGAVERP